LRCHSWLAGARQLQAMAADHLDKRRATHINNLFNWKGSSTPFNSTEWSSLPAEECQSNDGLSGLTTCSPIFSNNPLQPQSSLSTTALGVKRVCLHASMPQCFVSMCHRPVMDVHMVLCMTRCSRQSIQHCTRAWSASTMRKGYNVTGATSPQGIPLSVTGELSYALH